jgi:hypothetical protein
MNMCKDYDNLILEKKTVCSSGLPLVPSSHQASILETAPPRVSEPDGNLLEPAGCFSPYLQPNPVPRPTFLDAFLCRGNNCAASSSSEGTPAPPNQHLDRSMASPAAGTPPFLTKTYAMVEDPSTDDTISWNDTGTAFVVWRPAEFTRDLLPKHFKHSNFSSFVWQLNTYVRTQPPTPF